MRSLMHGRPPAGKARNLDTCDWDIWNSAALACRRITAGDLPFVASLFADPMVAADLSGMTDTAGPSSEDWVARYMTHWEHHGIGPWVVSENGNDIGICALTVSDGFEGMQLGVHLCRDHWGEGRATLLVQGLCEMAASLPRVPPRVFGLVGPDNVGALRVLGRAGFIPIGQVEVAAGASRLLVREIRQAEAIGDLPL